MIGENTTYPIPLLEKQSPRLLQHLSIGFLLAHIGVKVGRVGMHLFYPPRDDLSTHPKTHLLTTLFCSVSLTMFLVTARCLLSQSSA